MADAALFDRASLLMPDDHHFELIELGKAGADGPIVAERLVAVQLDEFVEDQVEIIGRHRPIGMPGDFDRFPRREIAEDFPRQLDQLAAQPPQLVAARPDFRARRLRRRRCAIPDRKSAARKPGGGWRWTRGRGGEGLGTRGEGRGKCRGREFECESMIWCFHFSFFVPRPSPPAPSPSSFGFTRKILLPRISSKNAAIDLGRALGSLARVR